MDGSIWGVLQGAHTCGPAAVSCAGAAPHDEDEVMEQEPLEEERECHEYTEEAEQSSTDDDRHIEEVDPLESSPQSSTDGDRQTEGEDEVELSDEPTGEPADRPMDETAVKLIEGHPPNDELAEEHPPGDGLAEGHPLDYKSTETITVECPTLGQESPSGDAREEDRVVIHTSEDEMDHLC